jgi:hypothetical protein
LALLAQSCIAADANKFLGAKSSEAKVQWLAMSPATAAQLVEGDLEGFKEVDLFRTMVRRFQHHIAEASNVGDDNSHNNRRSAAVAAVREKVASLLEGIRTHLMSINDLSDVVEPSGLFTYSQLAIDYKQAAHSHHYIIPDLCTKHFYFFNDRVQHRKIIWHLAVKRESNRCYTTTGYIVCIKVAALKKNEGATLMEVSVKGLSVSVFYNHHCLMQNASSAATLVSVPGEVHFTVPVHASSFAGVERAIILVHVPTTAFIEV